MEATPIKPNVIAYARYFAFTEGKNEGLQGEEKIVGIIVSAIHELMSFESEAMSQEKFDKYFNDIPKHNPYLFSKIQEEIQLHNTKGIEGNLAHNATLIMEKLPQLLVENTPHISFVYQNFGVKNYDNKFDIEKRKKRLTSTIEVFKDELEIIRAYKPYVDYEQYLRQKIDSSTTSYTKSKYINKFSEYLVTNMERKINDKDDKDLQMLLNSLDNIEGNFYIYYKGKQIFPLILDLLIDTVSIDFAFFLDEYLIKKNLEAWKEAKVAQEERGFYTRFTYHRLEFINEVGYQNFRSYLLHEYTKALQKDEKDVQKFFQNVLYNIPEDNKKAPQLPKDDFRDIPSRRFLLQYTKIVLGQK